MKPAATHRYTLIIISGLMLILQSCYSVRISNVNGDLDDTWKNYRSALLSKQMADLFSNDFLDNVKLSDYRVNSVFV